MATDGLPIALAAAYYACGDPSTGLGAGGGQRTELAVLGQGTVYYRYNEVGGMISVLDGKTDSATYYDYGPERTVARQQHPNATTTYFNYDPAGRMSEKVTVKDAVNSVLVRFAYTRDAGGNPIAIERESGLGVFYYAYDALQRLAYEGQFVDAARQYENYYEYDPAGNRSLLRHGETGAENLTYYAYNAANELTQLHDKDGWTYFAYDANGNTVTEQTPSYTRYFDWDGRDMLLGVRSTDPAWTDNEMRYDGMASRAALVDSTGMTYYAWDGIRVLKTEDGAGSLRQRQVHGYAPIPSVGDIALIESAAGDPYAPIPDQVGTNWKVLDSAAAIANSYQYDAFGLGRAANETFSNPYRFAGKPLDPDPTLYHFIARQYSPIRTVFLSRDPFGPLSAGPDYVYAAARPTILVDPSGLQVPFSPTLNFFRRPPYRAEDFGRLEEAWDPPPSPEPDAFWVVGDPVQPEGRDEENSTQRNLERPTANRLGISHVDIYYGRKQSARMVYQGFTGPSSVQTSRDISGCRLWALGKAQQGELRWGSGKGTCCEDASHTQILDCLASAPAPSGGEREFHANPLKGNNCQTDVEHKVQGCCLVGFKALGPGPDEWSYLSERERDDIRAKLFGRPF